MANYSSSTYQDRGYSGRTNDTSKSDLGFSGVSAVPTTVKPDLGFSGVSARPSYANTYYQGSGGGSPYKGSVPSSSITPSKTPPPEQQLIKDLPSSMEIQQLTQSAREQKMIEGYNIYNQTTPRTMAYGETPTTSQVSRNDFQSGQRYSELTRQQREEQLVQTIRTANPNTFKGITSGIAASTELEALQVGPEAINLIYFGSPVTRTGSLQVPVVSPMVKFFGAIPQIREYSLANPELSHAQSSAGFGLSMLIGGGISSAKSGKVFNDFKGIIESRKFTKSDVVTSGTLFEAQLLSKGETFARARFKGDTPFQLQDFGEVQRATALSTITGEPRIVQSTLFGRQLINEPSNPGFLAKEGIKLTSKTSDNLIIPTGQIKLFDDTVTNFPRGRTETPNILLTQKSIEATNPRYKIFDFINPEKNFFEQRTIQQTIIPKDVVKTTSSSRNVLYELYGKTSLKSVEKTPIIDNSKFFDFEPTPQKAVLETSTISFNDLNLRQSSKFNLEYPQDVIVTPKTPVVEKPFGQNLFNTLTPSMVSGFGFSFNNRRSSDLGTGRISAFDSLSGISGKSALVPSSIISQSPSISLKQDISPIQGLIPLQSQSQSLRSRQDLVQLQRFDQVPKSLLYNDSVLSFARPRDIGSPLFSGVGFGKLGKGKKFKGRKSFGLGFGKSDSNVYILPDLMSVSKTEYGNFLKFGGGEAIAPRATKRVKGLSYAAFTGGSSGFVPTEQMRLKRIKL